MTEEVRQKVLSMDVPQGLKDLCMCEDFQVQSTQQSIKPRNSAIWQLEATDIQVEVHLEARNQVYLLHKRSYCQSYQQRGQPHLLYGVSLRSNC